MQKAKQIKVETISLIALHAIYHASKRKKYRYNICYVLDLVKIIFDWSKIIIYHTNNNHVFYLPSTHRSISLAMKLTLP